MTNENWKPIPGYEDSYEVSDRGNVRSIDRKFIMKNGVKRHVKSRILSQTPNGRYGYMGVNLGNGNRKYVHRLVASAFLDLEKGDEVDHINGDTSNNSLSNLRCVTHADNMKLQRERKPFCKRGHKYEDVAFWRPDGRRECGECRRIRDRNRIRRYAK